MMSVSDTSIWAIVPAAGVGRRMGRDIPKQYLPLLQKTVIEHTLKRLLAVERINSVIVVLHQHDHYFANLPIAKDPRVLSKTGGDYRSDSVLAALESLEKKAKPNDWILVHDSVRCCIRTSKIHQLLDQLAENPVGGILAVPSRDTLKQSNFEGDILKTLDRNSIWQAQTPQLFRFDILHTALRRAREQQETVNDESSAIELMKLQPHLVEGHYDNIKITHPEDLVIAEAILKQQRCEGEKI